MDRVLIGPRRNIWSFEVVPHLRDAELGDESRTQKQLQPPEDWPMATGRHALEIRDALTKRRWPPGARARTCATLHTCPSAGDRTTPYPPPPTHVLWVYRTFATRLTFHLRNGLGLDVARQPRPAPVTLMFPSSAYLLTCFDCSSPLESQGIVVAGV